MQTADLVLAISVPLVTGVAGWVGVEMSLKPPTTSRGKVWYRVVFSVLITAAIVLNIWQTARSSAQQEQIRQEALQTERELSGKLNHSDGKLDAIAQFERQFLEFLNAHQTSNNSDTTSRAYQSMAQAILRLAKPTASVGEQQRHVTPAQIVQMRDVLEKQEPRDVVIATLGNQMERKIYANELAEALSHVKWRIIRHDVDASSLSTPDLQGVIIFQHMQSNMPDVRPVIHVLDAGGIENRIVPVDSAQELGPLLYPDRESSTLVIYVGPPKQP